MCRCHRDRRLGRCLPQLHSGAIRGRFFNRKRTTLVLVVSVGQAGREQPVDAVERQRADRKTSNDVANEMCSSEELGTRQEQRKP